MKRLAFGALTGAVAFVCACDPKPEKDQEETVQNQEIVDAIATEINRPPGGFTKVDGTYRDDASTAQEVTFTIRCDTCDAQQVIDQVVEAVWTSEVEPLRTISVSVTGPGGYQADTVVIADRQAELTDKYGERPAS